MPVGCSCSHEVRNKLIVMHMCESTYPLTDKCWSCRICEVTAFNRNNTKSNPFCIGVNDDGRCTRECGAACQVDKSIWLGMLWMEQANACTHREFYNYDKNKNEHFFWRKCNSMKMFFSSCTLYTKISVASKTNWETSLAWKCQNFGERISCISNGARCMQGVNSYVGMDSISGNCFNWMRIL